MHKISVSNLRPIQSIPAPMLHKSGVILLHKGAELTDSLIGIIRDSQVDHVYFQSTKETIEQVRRDLTYTSRPVSSLISGNLLNESVFDKNRVLLLRKGSEIPNNFASALARRDIDVVYLPVDPAKLQVEQAKKVLNLIHASSSKAARLTDADTVAKISNIKFDELDPSELKAEKLDEKLAGMKELAFQPAMPAFSDQIVRRNLNDFASESEKCTFTDIVTEMLNAVRRVYHDISQGRRMIDIDLLEKVAVNLMAGTIKNQELMLLCGHKDDPDEYLVYHSLATATLAANIAAHDGYSMAQVKALVYGAILADIGMQKVSIEIRNKKTPLTKREYAEIRRHPVYGLDLLQRVSRLPVELPFIVYQSHECPNGSGYPCGKSDRIIHPFAKIVMVCDTYTAYCATRPHRTKNMPYRSMEHLLKLCGKRLVSRDAVRSLLASISLFPIGSFLLLGDGRIARTISSNTEMYARPRISVLYDPEGNLLAKPERIDLSVDTDIPIASALFEENLPTPIPNPMHGF